MVFVRILAFAASFSFLSSAAAGAEYVPRAEAVAEHVYAIVGPLGQRSKENYGLNANYGVIVTAAGTILIDSGASRRGAEKLAQAVRAVTDKPIRWVINTGSQDNRWLGNEYFASQGAEIIALRRTTETQAQQARPLLDALKPFLGETLEGTRPLSASKPLADDPARLELGGVTLELMHTDAHFPGDAMVYLPQQKIVFAGDLVYIDRLLSVRPSSSLGKGQKAFRALAALKPAKVVPGHGRVCDLDQAQREVGDYYDFLVDKVGAAAKDMEPMDEVMKRYADVPAFRNLDNYASQHRINMNRAFTEFEGQ